MSTNRREGAPARSIHAAYALAVRRPALTVFFVALAARVVAAAVVFAVFGGALLLDDRTYSNMAAAMAAGETGEWSEYQRWLYERTAVLLVPVTALYWVAGPVEMIGQLYVATLGAGTAAIVTRLAMEFLDRRFALVAGLIVALLPSQILWSSLLLKDAGVWLALSALGLAVAVAARSTGARLVWPGASILACLGALGYLRLHTLVIAAWAVALASLFGTHEWRMRRAAVAFALAVAIPWAFGLGPAGTQLVANAQPPSDIRAANAVYAETAVATSTGGAQPRSVAADVRHIPRGVSVVLFEPVPWQVGGSAALQLARAEAPIWYAIVAFAVVGLGGVVRFRLALAFTLLVGGAVLLAYGLTEGNVGTAYRHRGELVWVVSVLAAVGVASLAGMSVRRREEREA